MRIVIDGQEHGGSGGGGGGSSEYASAIQVGGKIINFSVDDNNLPEFDGTYWQDMIIGGENVKVLMVDQDQA